MGSILDGLNPVNKIGTAPTNANSTLNTISTQGFKLNTGNLLSNITNPKKSILPGGNFSSTVPNVEAQANERRLDVILGESSGYEIFSATGVSTWSKPGESYNSVATRLGVAKGNEIGGLLVEGAANAFDYVVLKGTGKVALFGKRAISAGNMGRIALGIRAGGSAFNYSYGQGYDLPSSLLMALGTQFNFQNFHKFGDLGIVKNSKILSNAAHTSEVFYDWLHHKDFIPHKYSFLQGHINTDMKWFSGDFLTPAFTGKIPLGARMSQGQFVFGNTNLRPGPYGLAKAWLTPTAFFKGKFGLSTNAYETKYDKQAELSELAMVGLEQANNQTSIGADTHGTTDNFYDKAFISTLTKFQTQQMTSDFGSATKRFSDQAARINQQGLNFIGRQIEYNRNLANFAYEQIDEFQTYKAQQNDYQSTLFKTGNYYLASKELPKTVIINLGLSVANIGLGITRVAANAPEALFEAPAKLVNSAFVFVQMQAANIASDLEKLSNWWNGKPNNTEEVTAPANGIAKFGKNSKKSTTSVTHTLIKFPPIPKAVVQNKSLVDNVRLVATPALIKTQEERIIEAGTAFFKNERQKVQKQLDELTEDHETHWYSLSTPKWSKDELKKFAQLKKDVDVYTVIEKGVAQAIKLGRVKYNETTKKFYKIW